MKLTVLPESDLLELERPAQYIGGEKNSVVKDDAEVRVHFALAFPDTYEVGMSHLGIQILYDVLNRDPEVWAERVYMPLGDMEQKLREQNLPLVALESKRPLSQFHILGFSLQYELCTTNILAMLELGGISRWAKDRRDDEPLVIGGGPWTHHPEPIADFFDAFLLGDAEEAALEMAHVVAEARAAQLTRSEILIRLSQVDGVYIPSHFQLEVSDCGHLQAIVPLTERKSVTRRILPSLSGAPFPTAPVVPNVKTVHNRLSVEVMRGCVRGCRFCQAGYLYRPQRERSPEEIMKIIQDSLPKTGFEELSLLSLSTADYCSIVPVLKELMNKYGDGDRLAVSFPSTRVDALKPDILEQVQRVRRTGFTMAPEGGTQRLRDVINKGVSDDQIIETCSNVFRMGWTGVKLYFMLGLPTETDEDLAGIIDLARRIKALPGAKGQDITISVSTHVPKPHTPFQWAEQITPEETVRRQQYLSAELKRVGVKFRYHDAFSSFLEGIFCRGGRELAAVIERAYENGCRLDAWTEELDEEAWMRAFAEVGIEPRGYLRERGVEETLPWDHLSCGIPKTYFAKEWERAVKAKETPDCLTKSCSICGACDYDRRRNVLWPRAETSAKFGHLDEPVTADGTPSVSAAALAEFRREPVSRVRFQFAKYGPMRFVGHLELVNSMQRAVRRAGLPIAYSLGFHPMPRMSFGHPLQLGIESAAEFVDFYLLEPVAGRTMLDEYIARLNEAMPDGLEFISATELAIGGSSLQELMRGYRYGVQLFGDAGGVIGRQNGIGPIDPQLFNELTIERKSKRSGKKTVSLSRYVSDVAVTSEGSFEFSLHFDEHNATLKPLEVVRTLADCSFGSSRVRKLETHFGERVVSKSAAGTLEAVHGR